VFWQSFILLKQLNKHNINKSIGLSYCQAEMYAGLVACCPLVSHGEYVQPAEFGKTFPKIRNGLLFVTEIFYC